VLFFLGLGASRAEPLPPVAIGFYMPVMREISRRDVEVSLRFWVEELARSISLTYRPVQYYDSMDEMKRDMAAGKINFIVANGMGVAQHFSPAELGDGFSGYKDLPENLLLVVRRDAGIRSAADLAGKRIGLLDRDELTDLYLETLLLKAWGKADWGRLGPVTRETRSGKLAHRLFFGQADAALIYRSGYEAAVALNPQVGQRLMILDDYTFKTRSPHIGLFSSQVPRDQRETIAKAAMKLNDTVRGRQVLQIYQADRLVLTAVRELDPYYELLEEHRALKAAATRRMPR
jgi:hypothetical protein